MEDCDEDDVPTVSGPLTWELPAVAVIVTSVLVFTGNVFTAKLTKVLPPGTTTGNCG